VSRSLSVSKSLRRGAAAAVFVVSVASLSACGDGSSAATSEVKPDVSNARVKQMHVANVALLSDPKQPGRIAVTATFVNDDERADTLTGISVRGVKDAVRLSAVGGTTGSVPVPRNRPVVLGGEGNAAAELETSSARAGTLLRDGAMPRVTFTFKHAGAATVPAPVAPVRGRWDGAGPSGGPTVKPSPSATPAKPTGSSTGTPHGKGSASKPPAGTPTSSESTGTAAH
jgi:copper(I)-binding protein